MTTFTHFHFCGGAGGAALGMSRSTAKVGSITARARCIGGIDSDPAACRDFKSLVGVEHACMDLFDRQMYVDFHGHEPPADWREVTIEDLRRWEAPDIVVVSAPCKGYSRLLSASRSDTPRYRALNRLVLRCVHLALCAWEDDPPSLFLIENVPAIQSRGRDLLDRVSSLFQHAGYAARETTHCAGEIGGLGQRRKRFLMVARHQQKVPALLYEPARRPLRTIGDVIGPMPLPGDPSGGPMHRLPNLSPLTWLRLALIPAGKDWRALRGLDLSSVGIESYGQHTGKMRVEDWLSAAHTITGADRVGSGAPSVADRRWGGGPYGVAKLTQPAATVTGEAAVSTGAFSVADPKWGAYSQYKVMRMSDVSQTITGQAAPGSGPFSVADGRPWQNAGHYGVLPWNQPAPCITGAASCDNGRSSVADPRGGILISEDGTWHRPLTILEMAALQGFDWPLVLDGTARARWQERIGNAIPPPAAQAIGSEMLRTLLLAKLGQTFSLSSTDVWVQPVALALSVDG